MREQHFVISIHLCFNYRILSDLASQFYIPSVLYSIYSIHWRMSQYSLWCWKSQAIFFSPKKMYYKNCLLEHWFWLLYWKSHVLKRVLFIKSELVSHLYQGPFTSKISLLFKLIKYGQIEILASVYYFYLAMICETALYPIWLLPKLIERVSWNSLSGQWAEISSVACVKAFLFNFLKFISFYI